MSVVAPTHCPNCACRLHLSDYPTVNRLGVCPACAADRAASSKAYRHVPRSLRIRYTALHDYVSNATPQLVAYLEQNTDLSELQAAVFAATTVSTKRRAVLALVEYYEVNRLVWAVAARLAG